MSDNAKGTTIHEKRISAFRTYNPQGTNTMWFRNPLLSLERSPRSELPNNITVRGSFKLRITAARNIVNAGSPLKVMLYRQTIGTSIVDGRQSLLEPNDPVFDWDNTDRTIVLASFNSPALNIGESFETEQEFDNVTLFGGNIPINNSIITEACWFVNIGGGGFGGGFELEFLNFDMNFFFEEVTPIFQCKAISDQSAFQQIFRNPNNPFASIAYFRRSFGTREDRYSFVSANMIQETSNYAVVTPARFMLDFCKAMAYTFFFDVFGRVNIIPIESLITQQVVIRGRVSNLKVEVENSMWKAGVNYGHTSPSVDFNLFRQNFAEEYTATANQHGGQEQMLDLVVQNLRIDYAGILLMRYTTEKKNLRGDNLKEYKDTWLIQLDNTNSRNEPNIQGTTVLNNTILGGGWFNVYLSPRRTLQKWSVFLRGLFGNFGLFTLTQTGYENELNQLESNVQTAPTGFNGALAEKFDTWNIPNNAQIASPIAVTFDFTGNIADNDNPLWQFGFFGLTDVTFIDEESGLTIRGALMEVKTSAKLEDTKVKLLLNQPLSTWRHLIK